MTLKELAEELNMSTTTVSRVLTGQEKKYRISDKTADKVRAMAKVHQFAPNQIARNLRLQKTNTIGLIIPDISNPFFANLARTVEVELRKRGKMVLLCDTKDETELERESLSLLMGRKVDGLLIAPIGKEHHHLIQQPEIPIVLIDRYFEDQDLSFVTTDNFLGACIATDFLIEKGHRNIACIQGLLKTTPNEGRVSGYKKTMLDNGLSDYIKVIGEDYSIANGYESTKTLLSLPEVPTAIFSLNNQISMGVMKALKEHRLEVPGEVSLISFDDQPYFDLLSPPLTAIKQPMSEIGRAAVATLFELLEGNHPPNQMLKPLFVERSSVAPIYQKP
ncbi:LacI family DNA-binding transcriptional regulator [Fulvivirgaceae bacterium BMA12]|uniref:LacI family DNA-binding transcriptional regulator n=1 Tax=Agaribacillus aureus TaxID=3051825 RepID=A0ABT8L9Z3_9BACT|nr:LacI family DNA-binding transcriptional regulator [Fulvivirgaceae bacterium BMA12]